MKLSIKTLPISIVIICGMIFALYLANTKETDTQIPAISYQHAKTINQHSFEQPSVGMAPIQRPKSIQGIDYPVEFSLDKNQHLIPTYAIKELFDHYLSTYGEAEFETIISLIQNEITEQLQEPARTEALSLLKRYLDYKIALAEHANELSIQNSPPNALLDQVKRSQEALQTLRAQFFDSHEYDSFFAEEDTHNAFMVEQLRINQDQSLSIKEKQQQLELASQSLPESVIESRTRVQKHANLRTHVTELKQQGANQQEIFHLREQTLGTEAATALAELDRERAQWQTRLTQFSEQRMEILNASMSDEDKSHAIEALVDSQFAPNEQKRVRAIANAGLLN